MSDEIKFLFCAALVLSVFITCAFVSCERSNVRKHELMKTCFEQGKPVGECTMIWRLNQ